MVKSNIITTGLVHGDRADNPAQKKGHDSVGGHTVDTIAANRSSIQNELQQTKSMHRYSDTKPTNLHGIANLLPLLSRRSIFPDKFPEK
jgi:hypothetical protein